MYIGTKIEEIDVIELSVWRKKVKIGDEPF